MVGIRYFLLIIMLTMTATMMVSFLSLACLLLWFAAVWVCWLWEIIIISIVGITLASVP